MSRLVTRRTFEQQGAAALGSWWAATQFEGGLQIAAGTERQTPPSFRGKFAICNETFKDWPFEQAFDLAAECGYQGIEIAPFTIANDVREVSAKRRREVRRQADQAGLEVVGLHWLLARTKGFHLTSPEPNVRRQTVRYLGELARFCADLGGSLLIFGSPQQRNLVPGVTRDQAMQHAAETIRQTLPLLEETNTQLALEPLSPRTTSFLRTAAEAVDLIKLVDDPRCQLILDCNAMATESASVPELIREHRHRLVHFHANDPNRQGPGFGNLDFVPIFAALREIDFRGWVSVEVFDYSPGAERLARESIAYMKNCLAMQLP